MATRHDSHAGYVLKGLRAGKHVFVEKPLCLTMDELKEIQAYYQCHAKEDILCPILMVGYNRRFSPLVQAIKREVENGPMAMLCRINAGAIPNDSWIQDPQAGGGRIIG